MITQRNLRLLGLIAVGSFIIFLPTKQPAPSSPAIQPVSPLASSATSQPRAEAPDAYNSIEDLNLESKYASIQLVKPEHTRHSPVFVQDKDILVSLIRTSNIGVSLGLHPDFLPGSFLPAKFSPALSLNFKF